jgi:ubiquinone/menaquinone biosynthesis C-methylase UbiE
MLDLDETIFSELIKDIVVKDKIVIDIGCGTGRHWQKIYKGNPDRLIGYDVSQGMLDILKTKFTQAETHLLKDNKLEALQEVGCDIIFSTLALAHIKNINNAFAEWNRILKPGGNIIITDYHPEALAKGGNRTFIHEGKQVAIKNYVHPISQIKAITESLGWKIEKFVERKIDESVKHYYEKHDALRTYDRFKDTFIIYGVYLKK